MLPAVRFYVSHVRYVYSSCGLGRGLTSGEGENGNRTFDESITLRPVLEAFLEAVRDLLALEFELFGLEGSDVTVGG
jgi:hypothetical protein